MNISALFLFLLVGTIATNASQW